MDSKQLVANVMPSVETLMKSTGNYVYRRIQNKKEKEAYRRAIYKAVALVKENFETFEFLKAKITGMRQDADTLFPKNLFNKRVHELRAFHMAIDHALEVISSVEGRFITGQSDAAPRNYNGKGFLYEDQSIFGDV